MTGMYDAMYLATEDKAYFERFQKEFSSKLIFIEQMRVQDEPGGVKQQRASIDLARMYLADVKCLSVCDDFVTNRGSGAFKLAMAWRHQDHGFCVIFAEDSTAPASPKLARIYLRFSDTSDATQVTIDNLDEAQHPFRVRRTEWYDLKSEPNVAIDPLGTDGKVRMRVRWQGKATLVLQLGSIAFVPSGSHIPVWVTYTSLRINGQEFLKRPVDVWNQKPYTLHAAILDSEEIELEVRWQPYHYTPEELTRLLRYRLPNGGTPRQKPIPVPKWPTK